LPDLPAATAGVVITIGITALLAGASGVTVKIAGNELGSNGTTARVFTAVVGIGLVAWSAWSLREQPFEVSSFGGSRLDLVRKDTNQCAADVEIGVLVRYHRAPGTIRYEVRLDGVPVKTFSQKEAQGSGTDLLGPHRIHVPPRRHRNSLVAQVVIVAPNLKHSRELRLAGPRYFAPSRGRCSLTLPRFNSPSYTVKG
jgi:hypothetical protein